MATFLYDGSFEGFLTLIHESYLRKKSAHRIVRSAREWDLTDENISIVTNRTHAAKVLDALRTKFEKRYYARIFHIFMCDSEPFEKPLYDYIVLGFRDQRHLADITHPSIRYIENLAREYFRYLHKMYGFVRFEELADGMLYARIEGKFNIVAPLGAHFAKRLNPYNFIIHDTKRALAYWKNDTGGEIHEVAAFEQPLRSASEEKFQKLWKTFFDSVTIPARRNIKLQKKWVPLLYRRYMTEFTAE